MGRQDHVLALFPGAVVLAIGQFHLYATLASLSVILHMIIRFVATSAAILIIIT
ncbi:MAG: hypothetical protein KAT13_03145 [Methanosarcinales archaeon]|nr:hypothetical protein [Methanosarcinales archaeon]MCK4652067.1 hypothetical protein [Methanosarcinales archaeon]